MSFKKVTCAYHSDQVITNFCSLPYCLMPLCPSCIATHNMFHSRNHTQAAYQTILDVLSETQSNVNLLLDDLDAARKQNVIISISKNVLRSELDKFPVQIQDKVKQIKKQAYEALDSAFSQLEAELKNTYKIYEADSAKQSIEKQIQLFDSRILLLQDINESLKGTDCLAGVIKFMTEQENFKKMLQPLKTHDISEKYSLVVSNSFLNNLKTLVTKSVTIHNLNSIIISPKKLEERRDTTPTKIKTVPSPGQYISPTRTVIIRPMGHQIPPSVVYSSTNSPIKTNLTPNAYQSKIQTQQSRSPNSRIFNRTSLISQKPLSEQAEQPREQQQKEVSNNRMIYNSNFDREYETLSRKVLDMRRENELLSKQLPK